MPIFFGRGLMVVWKLAFELQSMYWAAPLVEPLLVRRSLLGCPGVAVPRKPFKWSGT